MREPLTREFWLCLAVALLAQIVLALAVVTANYLVVR